MNGPSRRVRAVQATILLGFFLPVLHEWVSYCSQVTRLAYVLLVPLLAACLAVQRGSAAPRIDIPGHPSTHPLGPWLMLAGAGVYALGALTGIFSIQIAGFPLAATGLLASWGGPALLLRHARPLLLFWLLVPIPLPLLDGLNPGLVRASGSTALAMLLPFDPGTSWVGTELTFQGWTLIVADACSGSGTSLTLFVMAVFLGGLFKLPPRLSLLLAIGVLPLSLLVNGARIAATAMCLAWIGPEAASGLAHEVLGQVLVVGTMGSLVWLVLRLSRPAEKAACIEDGLKKGAIA